MLVYQRVPSSELSWSNLSSFPFVNKNVSCSNLSLCTTSSCFPCACLQNLCCLVPSVTLVISVFGGTLVCFWTFPLVNPARLLLQVLLFKFALQLGQSAYYIYQWHLYVSPKIINILQFWNVFSPGDIHISVVNGSNSYFLMVDSPSW